MANIFKTALIRQNRIEHEKVKPDGGEQEDERLIWQSFKQGSESAFIAIYKKYFQLLYNYGRQLSGDKDLIKDCIQDTFIAVRKSRTRLASVSSVKAYLLKCIRRKIIKALKTEGIRKKYMVSGAALDFQIVCSEETRIIERQLEADQLKDISQALQKLSKRQREAIYYYFYNDLSYNEIKEIMGFASTEAARNLIYRSLSALRKNFLK